MLVLKETEVPARKPRPEEKLQSERFIETARALGADESAEAFEQVFRDVVLHKRDDPTATKAARKISRRSNKLPEIR